MPNVSLWHQTITLLKRNFLIKIRMKSHTIQEIILPIYFVVLLALLKTFAYKPTAYGPFTDPPTVNLSTFTLMPNVSFFVAPNFTEAENLMEAMSTQNIFTGMSYTFFNSLNSMDTAYRNMSNNMQYKTIGIYFPNSNLDSYALRFRYQQINSGTRDIVQGNCRINDKGNLTACPAMNYITSGFGRLQSVIDSLIAQTYDSNSALMNVQAKMMPKEGTLANTDVFGILSPLYFVWALSPFMTFLLVNIVYEKEQKIKEGMKMMGLNDLAYWFSWGIIYSALLLVMTLVMTIISIYGNLFPLSNFFLIFLMLFLYGLSQEMLAYMLTPFFSKARSAGGFGSFLSVIISLLFLVIYLNPDLPEYAIWLLSLLAPVAFSFVINKITLYEVAGSGAHFYNIADGPNPIYIGLVMLIVDIFLYFLLTLYLDAVVPTEYGRKKSPIFFLKPSYWCKSRRHKNRTLQRQSTVKSTASYYPSCDNIEAIPQEFEGEEAIRIQNVTKVFKKNPIFTNSVTETTAVKNFTLDIFKGQITALLGHNGAGKTTLFNILTGFTDSTRGSIMVYDYDVSNSEDMFELRKMTGVCPQHDIHHMALSVEEHLNVFAGLKGYSGEELETEVTRVLNIIGLTEQRVSLAKNLSGGQKRKLSVGIAILGDPKILILDEPTAGMDPFSRRNLWDLLRSGQENRVTLLTTHFMDEADILADRKAIISNGKLRCCGSSLFLKNRFGVGYHLGIVTKTHEDERPVTSCVLENIQGAEIQRSVGMEHSYTLPLIQVPNFAGLFSTLDKRQEELKIQSYGVSMTTLEEVFLKIGQEDDAEEESSTNGYVNPSEIDQVENRQENVILNVNGTKPTFDVSRSESAAKTSDGRVILAMLKRAFLINIRSPAYIFWSFVVPIVLSVLGVYVITLQPESNTDDPPLVDMSYIGNLESYSNKPVLYQNSTGASLDDFTSNVLNQGLRLENVNLSDANKLLTTDFYPHFVGLDVKKFSRSASDYVAVYNSTYLRSLSSALNVFGNSLISYLGGNQVKIYIKDWPKTDNSQPFNGGTFGGVLMVALSLVLTTSFAAIYPVKEREQKIRGQLRVSGVRFQNYWIPWLIHDYVINFIIIVCLIISIYGFNIQEFKSGGAIGALIILLLGWGVSCILCSYCFSFMFSKFETVSSAAPALIQLISLLPYIVVSTLDMTMVESNADEIANIFFVIFIPYYVGFSGIYYIFKVYIVRLFSGQDVINIPSHVYFDWSNPMIPLALIMVYVHILVFSVLLLVLDIKKQGGKLPTLFGRKSQVNSSDVSLRETNQDIIEGEDGDVLQERSKVNEIIRNDSQSGENAPLVVVDSLRKEFQKRTEKRCASCREPDIDLGEDMIKVAVRNLSFTVQPGEVMGLLGPNGAGKTTALNVLIADVGPTKGMVTVAGHPITSTISEAFKVMGYCPQSNPLWDEITLREHLEIYAVFRGVPESKIASTVDNFIDALDVREHSIKRAITLSGGTKRKLCFAISMLGNPEVVLLDEPSTGMDPKTKRFMWDTISSAFEGSNRGAILTTHYMEEADALCSRVGIMVRGQLKCVGSTQHLKDKFGQGYILEVKLEDSSEQEDDDGTQSLFTNLDNFVKKIFPDVERPEKFGSRVTYKVKKEDVKSLSMVFSSLEEAKGNLRIEEYSFSQSTLEQVFLRFAKEQAEKDEEEQQRIDEIKKQRKLQKKKNKSCW